MKFKILVLALLAALVSLAGAQAKAHGANLPPAGSGTITIDPAYTPAFQAPVAFDVTGTDGLKNPRVVIDCYQGTELVYGEAGSPSQVYTLGANSSVWIANGGGPADCTAELYYIPNKNGNAEWNGNGQQGAFVYLASLSFTASG